MADVLKTIKASGGDYATLTTWEADLDDSGIYSSGDVAQAEIWDFITESSEVRVDGGDIIGLIRLEIFGLVSARHDGTAAGPFAGINYTGTGNEGVIFAEPANLDVIIEWLDLDANADDASRIITFDKGSGGNTTSDAVRNCIIHANNGLKVRAAYENINRGFVTSAAGCRCLNNIMYDISTTAQTNFAGIRVINTGAEDQIINNTLHKIATSHSTRNAYGIWTIDDADKTIKNNLVITVAAVAGAKDCYNPAMEITLADTITNGASDLTGSAGLDSLTTSEFVSTTPGSEDLHLLPAVTSENAGTDLGVSPTNVEIDIDGSDRDALGSVWDIGAHEVLGAPVHLHTQLRDRRNFRNHVLTR